MNFIKKFYFTWINPKPLNLNEEELRELLDTSSIDIEKVEKAEHDNWLKNRKKYILYLFFSWIIFFILFFLTIYILIIIHFMKYLLKLIEMRGN